MVGDEPDSHDAIRVFAAVHQLVLTGVAPNALDSWSDLAAALRTHLDAIQARLREPVQTNEVQRCTALLPAFLTVAREAALPLELLELGPSSGLNLLVDRYGYGYTNGEWGPRDALLRLVAEERGGRVPASLLREQLAVRRRRGIDLSPVDATTEAGYLLLRSYLWPGREDRVEKLDAAVATLRLHRHRLELERGDYVELLHAKLAARPQDAVTVVFQSASTGYLSAAAAALVRRTLEEAGADGRPLAWVSTRRSDEREGSSDEFYELELRIWPGPPQLAAYLDFHGNWLDWRL